MSRYYTLLKFLSHRLQSRRWDAFHSPYLFKLFTYCCNESELEKAFDQIETERLKMIHSKDMLQRTDYGAGTNHCKRSEKTQISAIARNSLSLPFQCRFLYRLMKWINPQICIEFGTSLGISSSYLALADKNNTIISIEGDPQIALIAQKLFDQLHIKNVRLINSTFEDFITKGLPEAEKIDFIFLDGNHRSIALKSYYMALRSHFSSNTIVMVDDIYWSSDMYTGWKSLREMPEVTQSVNCFHFGLLFFNPQFMNKEHHRIHLPSESILKRQ